MTATPDVLPVVERADHVPGARQGQWDYEHYAAIPDDGNRYEVVNGVLYMAPAPGAAHQKAVLRIATFLMTHVEFAGLGDVLMAPFDVELQAGGSTVVQPDVLVVLSEHQSVLTPSHAIGAPDLVVEVASPS